MVSRLVCKTWVHTASCYATLNLCWQVKQSSHQSGKQAKNCNTIIYWPARSERISSVCDHFRRGLTSEGTYLGNMRNRSNWFQRATPSRQEGALPLTSAPVPLICGSGPVLPSSPPETLERAWQQNCKCTLHKGTLAPVLFPFPFEKTTTIRLRTSWFPIIFFQDHLVFLVTWEFNLLGENLRCGFFHCFQGRKNKLKNPRYVFWCAFLFASFAKDEKSISRTTHCRNGSGEQFQVLELLVLQLTYQLLLSFFFLFFMLPTSTEQAIKNF